MKQKKQKVPLYDLRLPSASLERVSQTIRSGWLSSGEQVRTFEQALAQRLGVPGTVATNSATSALIATLQAIGITGREVITTPITFVATIEAILAAGGKPILADIDPATLNIDPDDVRRKVSDKTAVIMPVDMAGQPADYDALRKIAKENRLALIADASHSLGATWRGKSMAQLCDGAVYSFHATKNLVCGEGGLLATKSRRLEKKVRLLTRHGITAIAFDRASKKEHAYDVVELGFKGSMSELHAAVGLGHLTQIDSNQNLRAKLAGRYYAKLKAYADYLSLPINHELSRPAYHLFIIRLNLKRWKINRAEFMKKLASHGIETGLHFRPVYQFSYYRRLLPGAQALPQSAEVAEQVVTLPLYPSLKLTQVDYIGQVIGNLIERHGR